MKIYSLIIGIGTCFFAIFFLILFLLGIYEVRVGSGGFALIFVLNVIAIFANMKTEKVKNKKIKKDKENNIEKS